LDTLAKALLVERASVKLKSANAHPTHDSRCRGRLRLGGPTRRDDSRVRRSAVDDPIGWVPTRRHRLSVVLL